MCASFSSEKKREEDAMKFRSFGLLAIMAFSMAMAPGQSHAANLTLLVSFCTLSNCIDGVNPYAGLYDAAGNLLGTTAYGGAYDHGTVFEIAKTTGGYASSPIILVSFNGTDGNVPVARLIADASGNLLGTTEGGGAYGSPYGYGTVFEIAKTHNGYSSTPTTLVSFNEADGATPFGDLIADTEGNLFGTTEGVGRTNICTSVRNMDTARCSRSPKPTAVMPVPP
jgi:uncharacterized repeat protein (TIGR03803 family)